jgi:hypothetical protein
MEKQKKTKLIVSYPDMSKKGEFSYHLPATTRSIVTSVGF